MEGLGRSRELAQSNFLREFLGGIEEFLTQISVGLGQLRWIGGEARHICPDKNLGIAITSGADSNRWNRKGCSNSRRQIRGD